MGKEIEQLEKEISIYTLNIPCILNQGRINSYLTGGVQIFLGGYIGVLCSPSGNVVGYDLVVLLTKL